MVFGEGLCLRLYSSGYKFDSGFEVSLFLFVVLRVSWWVVAGG